MIYRYALLCALLTASQFLAAQPPERPLASTITLATVYLDGAQVNRTAEPLALPAGRSTLVFTELTADLDPGSLQVAADNMEDLTILSVTHRLNFNERPADPAAAETGLLDRIDALEDRRRRFEAELAIAKEEEELLKANRDLTGDAQVNAEDFARGVEFYRERMRAIKLTYLALSDSLRANAEARELRQQQLSELGKSRERPVRAEVVVEVLADRAVTSELRLSYLVAAAGWTPEYDVRVDKLSEPVDLRYRALVRQQTGEDWENVKLVLSTGDPTLSAEAPELPTWRVGGGRRPPVYRPTAKRDVAPGGYRTVRGRITDAEGYPLIGASVLIEGTNIGTVTDIEGNYEVQVPNEAEYLILSYTGFDTQRITINSNYVESSLEAGALLEEVVVTGSQMNNLADKLAGAVRGVRSRDLNRSARSTPSTPAPAPVPTTVQRRATTVAFAIKLPYTIASDGKPRRVEIERYAVPAVYTHLAVPKLRPETYLTAALTDWEQYDLISGNLQLFFEGTYLGQSYLDVEQTADTLNLSLGRDPGVVVTRRADRDYRSRGGLFGSKQVEARGYTIAVRNTKDQPVQLTVVDQVPLAANDDIDIELDIPAGAVYDEKTGRVTWKLVLAPREERTLAFGYTVRAGRGERLYLE